MLQTQPWPSLLLVFIFFSCFYILEGIQKERGSKEGCRHLFRLERGDMTNQEKGSREGLYGRKWE